MMSPKLPSVLQQPNGNSLSMERALKQIRNLLLQVEVDSTETDCALTASLDDVDIMLGAIDR